MATIRRGADVRRILARSCAIAAVVCLALAGLGSASAQEGTSPTRPDVFRASASAQVASVFLDRDALLPVNDALRFIALDGAGTYESSNQTARASLFYPGNGVIAGPTLACDTFGGQFPPELAPILEACTQLEYPLTVFADSLDPDGTSAGAAELGTPADPVSAKAVRAVAHAAIDASRTDAALSALRVVGLPAVGSISNGLPVPGAPELDPTILAVESATSTTHQRIDENGRLVVEAEAVLDGLRLVGGLVEIDSIRSVSSVTDDGKGDKTRHSDLVVEGVSVGGIPAKLTEDGLVIGSPLGVDGPLVQQVTGLVNELLRDLGVRIATLAAEDGVDDDGVAFARAGGLLMELDVDAQGLPTLPGPTGDVDPNGIYTGTIQLGATGVRGVAAHIDAPPFDAGVSSPADQGGPAAGTGSGTPEPTSASGVDDRTAIEASDEAAAPGVAANDQTLVSIAEALAPGRVALTYVAFTLMALSLCLGPRFFLPARLPGSAP